MPDIQKKEIIFIDRPVKYVRERDYFRSGLNVLFRKGLSLPCGYHCTVRGRIPINSGTSSSSALMVAWISFLLTAGGDERAGDPAEVARLAFEAEVLEFHEPGGMMDHFAASFGRILYIDFGDPVSCERIDRDPGTFVLGDSKEPKDTKTILSRVKNTTLRAMALLLKADRSLQIDSLSAEELARHSRMLSQAQTELLSAHIRNRELTRQARALFQSGHPDRAALGRLLNLHQEQLREGLAISTPKIDRMIDASLKAGALGAKINGSGGGGCMFAYAPDCTEAVAEAIRRADGIPYIITPGEGAVSGNKKS
jgi:galactokinase